MTTQSGKRGKSKSSLTRNTTQMKTESESMRKFNYHGPTRLNELDENDIAGLEREIDFIVRNNYQ